MKINILNIRKSYLLFGIFLTFTSLIYNIQTPETGRNAQVPEQCTEVNYETTDFLNVENIQKFLYTQNLYNGKINGYKDDALIDSIKEFQELIGIRIDGIVGPSTHKAMSSFNNCTNQIKADFIECDGYLAYKECTFFVSDNESTELIENLNSNTSNETRYLIVGGGSCNYSLRSVNLGDVDYQSGMDLDKAEKTLIEFKTWRCLNNSSSSSSGSGSLTISNLNGTISINENQKSVVTISASGTGGLTYSLSGTDAHLMSVNSSGVVTLNSDADYEQKTGYTATATVTDSVGSTSKTLSVSVADTTEYATVKVVTWYDGNTLANCSNNIIVNNTLVCGINTPSKLATSWEETEIWQNKWFSNSVVDLRVDTVTPQEWTSLTNLEANAIALDSYDPLYVFAPNEQVNKYAIRNGIHISHLLNTWASANQNQCSAFSPLPSTRLMQRHLISWGIIKAFGCFSHELGHSLGLSHAVNQATNPASYASGTYYYGYYDSTNNT